MRRVTLRCAARLVVAALWLLVEECRAETGDPSLAERVIWAVNAGGDTQQTCTAFIIKKIHSKENWGKVSAWGCDRLQKRGYFSFLVVWTRMGGICLWWWWRNEQVSMSCVNMKYNFQQQYCHVFFQRTFVLINNFSKFTTLKNW